MSEKPNTKFYFDEKIARVVFVDDVERKAYWFDTSRILLHHINLRYLHRHYRHPYLLLPIEEWLKEQGMTRVEDDMVLFSLVWNNQ